MIYATFEQWSASGYKILKGAKSHKRNEDGKALFAENQVEEFYGFLDEANVLEADDGMYC